jgi:hypothetical protein
MYCDRCGTRLDDNVNFCRACGHRVAGVAAMPDQGSIAAHVRLLGILWIARSALLILPAIALFTVARHVHMPVFVQAFLPFIGLLFLAAAVLGFVAGWGLLQRQPWARTLTIVLGILALFDVPIGTALGIYTLWVLLPQRPGLPGAEPEAGPVVPRQP